MKKLNMKKRDPRETYAAAASACFVATIFLYVFIVGYMAPLRHEVVIQEIFAVEHTKNRLGEDYTDIYTVGQGQYYFRGNHGFQIGHSYRVVFHENMDRWRDLTLLDWVEVIL